MLRFTTIANVRQAESYYEKSDGGYYQQTTDLHREWGGQGAAMLGLSGEPDYGQFKRLINGLDPHTGGQLTAKLIEDRIPGWDVTASLPKGVTTALECGDERIHELLWQAGRWAMADLEELATTRVRKGGREEDRLTQNILWYGKEDGETRPTKADAMPDWDRHIHFVVLNLTKDQVEGEWKALKFRPIMDLRKYFSHRFDLYMSKGLADLGYEIETKYKAEGKGGGYYSWDIKGIPQTVIAKNSRRSAEVENAEENALKSLQEKVRKQNREEGRADPIPRELSAVARDKLGATSRLGKRDDLTLDDCRAYWQGRLTQAERGQIAETIRCAVQGKNPRPANTAERAAAFAAEHWFHRHSVLKQKARHVTGLYVTAMERCMGTALPADLERAFQKLGVVSDREALPVWDSAKEVTTTAVHAQEQFIRDVARQGRGRERPAVPPQLDVRPLLAPAPGERELTEEQARACTSLLRSRDTVNVVDAGQGTGKTTMLGRYGQILDRIRQRSTWLGTTHTAVRELAKEGRPAMTVAAFLHSEAEQRRAAGSRIIVDEVSMLSHRDAYRLFRVAREQGCRLDLVADSKQYKNPSAGEPVRLLTQYAGVIPITMTQTMRQQGQLKEAMEAIRDGHLAGHDMLEGLGMVHEMPLEKLAQAAADLYLQWSAEKEAVPVISPTWAQAKEIAARIRQGLRERGDLTGKEHVVRRLVNLDWSPPEIREAKKHGGAEGVVLQRYGAYREEWQTLAIGDLVRTTMGGKTKDGRHRICNGQNYSITAFTKAGDPILNNGWVVDKNWGGLMQRYVTTGQAQQGATANRGIVVYGTPSLVATRQDGFYVPVSRVRKTVAVLTDSKEALREAIQRQDTRKLASELLEPRRPRKSELRQRLGKHLASMRRLAFSRLHEWRQAGRQRTPPFNREMGHGR